jgi:hypothetical protein
MRVVFEKRKRGLCWWTAYPPKRRPVSANGGGSTGHFPIPHDLAQLVVERELGHRYGFWGCVADGATFRTLVRGGRKRTKPGVALIRDHVPEIDAAEHAFHLEISAWLRGETTPATAALAEVLEQWQALAEHESFEVEFPLELRSRGRYRAAAGARSAAPPPR